MTQDPAPAESGTPVWDAEAAVNAVRQKIQTVLLRDTEIGLDPQGRLTVDRGSTRVYINFAPQELTETVYVTLTAPIAFYVPMTPALYEYIARESDKWFWGHICMSPYPEDGDNAGTAYIYLTDTLLGDFLDPLEVTIPVLAVVNTANAMDEDFTKEFGGVRYSES